MMNDAQLAILKVAENINKKRRQELFDIYSNSDLFNEIKRMKALGVFDQGSKSKVWRKIATLPLEVDAFFTKVFGPEYYKDPDFFKKHAPEWMVVNT